MSNIRPKRKVHAQRKFAQGSFTPALCSTPVSTEKRVEVPPKDVNSNKEGRVYLNHYTVQTLLDYVTFHKLHSHAESYPVVVLERLSDVKEDRTLRSDLYLRSQARSEKNTTSQTSSQEQNDEDDDKPLEYIRSQLSKRKSNDPAPDVAVASSPKIIKLNDKRREVKKVQKSVISTPRELINKKRQRTPRKKPSVLKDGQAVKVRRAREAAKKLRTSLRTGLQSSVVQKQVAKPQSKISLLFHTQTHQSTKQPKLGPRSKKVNKRKPAEILGPTEEPPVMQKRRPRVRTRLTNGKSKSISTAQLNKSNKTVPPATQPAIMTRSNQAKVKAAKKKKSPQRLQEIAEAPALSSGHQEPENTMETYELQHEDPLLAERYSRRVTEVSIQQKQDEVLPGTPGMVKIAAHSLVFLQEQSRSKVESWFDKTRNLANNASTSRKNGGVERAVEKHTTDNSNKGDGCSVFKQPAPVHNPRIDDAPSEQPCPSPWFLSDVASDVCPSERYTNVQDIINAPLSEINVRCRKCVYCNRVEKVRQLKNVTCQTSEIGEKTDVYEFSLSRGDEPIERPNFRSGGADKNGAGRELDKQSRSLEDYSNEPGPSRINEPGPSPINEPGPSQINEPEPSRSNETGPSRRNEPGPSRINEPGPSRINEPGLSRRNEPGPSRINEPGPSRRKDPGLSRRNEFGFGRSTLTEPPIPATNKSQKVLDAPVFHPTEEEFTDPIAFFEKIMPIATKHGICKVVAPESFKPGCNMNFEHQFSITNQYMSRMYSRWGVGSREMSAIKAYLASQGVVFTRPPLIEGMEVNLPKLYHIVQKKGGLKAVIEKKKWGKVAEEMRLDCGPNPDKKLDSVYVKYLLPYGTLSDRERHQITGVVEKDWNRKNRKLLDRAFNPLHRQKKLLGESESSEDETEDEEQCPEALKEAEDCIVPGRKMSLASFKKVAATTMAAYFPGGEPTAQQVEKEYWRQVLLALDHVCVNAASIDTGDEGYGFTKNKDDPYGKHPWNLKVLSSNSGNVLRALGPVLGVTVPTLHIGMVFSTSCWQSDPQGLPWLEYHHHGAPKIWYGIPESEGNNFRRAVETLCPTSCQNKSIWLPSDIIMIPPNILTENLVSLSRVEQNPGEFVFVCPKAYSCSIATGYSVSESAYFAPSSWLFRVHQVFQEVRDSCEPTMFSLEQLLFALVREPKTPLSVLHQMFSNVRDIVNEELDIRAELQRMHIRVDSRKRRPKAWNVRDLSECEVCRTTLYLSMVTGIIHKKSALCLQHAKRMLNLPRYANIKKSVLVLTIYTSDESLKQVLELLESKLTGGAQRV